MKNISTLVPDIQAMVGTLEGERDLSRFSSNLSSHYLKQMGKREDKVRNANTLYFSEIGEKCQRKMWYRFHGETGSALLPATRIKFMYGDILEDVVLQLARDAGHTVEGEQQQVEYKVPSTDWTIRGRIDAIIDGVVVDVKSVTKMSEQKFHTGLEDDPFGYYHQLNGYSTVLRNKDMGFLTIQKELGHINYFPFTQSDAIFAGTVAHCIHTVSSADNAFATLADVPASATSKNMKLCTACSYCDYKKKCFPEVRGFAYSNKVEWLTKVVDLPRVPEISDE